MLRKHNSIGMRLMPITEVLVMHTEGIKETRRSMVKVVVNPNHKV